MSFQYPTFIPVVVAAIFLFALLFWRLERKFFIWVEDHWFYRPRFLRICADFFYITGIAFLLISLLDLRDRPIKVKNNIPQQRTVILIDTSSSMLVEDVQPNRLGKAIMLAKHFVKRAAGHAISVVLFSDYQKQIIPFTTDIDFLEARIGGLDQISLGKGSSNITAALQESLAYLKSEEDGSSQILGNILIISDAEENQEMFSLDIPNSVSVAMIAVGTNKGGPIPMRQNNGIFLGNKTYQGTEVISKVGDELLKNLADKIKNYKYWVVQSYSMPTEDILRFFSTTHKNKFSQGQSTIRVPRLEYLLLPGLLSLCLAFLLRMLPSFSVYAIVFIISFSSISGWSSSSNNGKKSDDDSIKLMEDLENRIKEGNSTDRDRLKLAEIYLRDKERKSEALTLFNESISGGDWKNLDPVDLSNYATALYENGDYEKGFEVASHLFSKNVDPKLQETARQNVLLALQSQESDEQKKQSEKEKKSQDQKNENNGQQKEKSNKGEGEKQDAESGDSQKENTQEKSEGQQSEKENGEKGKGDLNKEEKKEDSQGEKDNKKNEQQENQESSSKEKNKQEQEQSEKNMSPHMAKKLMNAQLKQLLEGDRQLQERFMNTTTTDKAKSQSVKDW